MKKILICLAVAMVGVAIMSCEKYEDGRPDRSVIKEFNRMYPDAKDIEWEPEGGYWKVSFETGTAPGRVEREAWYDAAGNWIRTETDMYLSSVPQNIRDFLAASEYASAVPEDNDVEYVETPDGNYYRFDLRLSGTSVYVDVTEEGKVSQAKFDW